MKTRISLLALCISLISTQGHALESLSDESMQEVSGQDGISISPAATAVTMQRLYWQEDGKDLQFRNVNISNFSSTIDLDFGADSDLASATPAVSLNVSVQPFLLTVGSIGICNAGATCATTFGEFAFETTTVSTLSYFNTNGFFDGSSSNGRFRFNLSNANIYMAQTFGGIRNLFMLRNLTLNGSVNGKFTIDATEGLRTQGTLSLNKSGTGSRINGLQFDFAHKSNQASGFTTTGSNITARFGMSGNIQNYDFKMRADNSLSGTGTQGVKISASGVLDKNTFQLELGHPSGYSVLFRNWVDLANGAAVVPSSPDFTLGDIYLNLIASGGTLPNFTTGYGAGFGSVGGVAADAYGVAVRGLNFQAYAKQLVFQNNTTFAQSSQNWSLITAFYNTDANLLLYPDGHPAAAVTPKRGMGFDLKIATTGRDGTGKEGTHLLIADPTAGTYLGWRNLDSQITLGQSQLYFADTATDGVEGLKLASKNLVMDLSGEFAVGRLPNGSSVTSIRNDDEMFGLRVRMAGELAFVFSPPPAGSGYIGLSGQLVLNGGGLNNSISIIEPTDGTQLQFSNMSGTINLNTQQVVDTNYTDASRIEVGNSLVTVAGSFSFGPGSGVGNVFRIGDVNLVSGSTYRLGEIVIPGGRLYAQIDIKPQ